MADNVLETVQKLVQDVVAPDVRAIKVKVEELEKRIDERFKASDQHIDERFKAMEQRLDLAEKRADERHRSIGDRMDMFEARFLAAIADLKSSNELLMLREIVPVRERLAVVEYQVAHQRSAA